MLTIRTPKNIFESDHIIRYSSPQGSSSKEKTSKCYVLTLYSAAEKARGSDLRCLLLHSKLPVKLTLHLAEVQRHANEVRRPGSATCSCWRRWIHSPFSFTAHEPRIQNERRKYNSAVRQEIVLVSLVQTM